MSSTCPRNMVNFGPLAAEIGPVVWGTPGNFNGFRVLAALYCSDIAQRKPTKLCTVFGRCLGWYTTYTFSGVLAPLRNFDRCKIHFAFKSCTLVFWQLYCTALQQQAAAKLCGVEHRASPVFVRAAITLGIGPHSSIIIIIILIFVRVFLLCVVLFID